MAMGLLTCALFLQAQLIFSEQVKISGPRYVQRNKPLHLTCISSVVPFGQTVEFYRNDTSYANIYIKNGRCYRGQTECVDSECMCYNDGRSYALQYQETRHSGVVTFTCLMRFESGQNAIEDSITIQIVDVDGPYIISGARVSMIAGSKTTLMCTVNTTLLGFDLNLTCLNKTVRHAPCSSCFPSIEMELRSELTGHVCKCSFKWKELMIHETLEFKIKNSPVISLESTAICFSREPVILTCRLLGELSSFGFIDWTQNVNGKLIRYIKTNQTGNTTQLSIKSCTYMDIGDYRCTAYNNDGNETIWTNKTITITMLGPPVVVHSYMVQGLYTVLTAICYSVSKINETKWYFFEELLENSSENSQAMTKELVSFPIYNEKAKIPVHVINLTISAPKSGLYTVIITNRYGEIKHQFQLRKDMDGFYLSAIIWGLIAIGIFLVTFSVSTIIVRGCVTNVASIIHNAPVIYHAAPYFGSEVHSYDITGPEYDDCDVSMSGSLDRRINHNADIQLHNSKSSCIYEEIK